MSDLVEAAVYQRDPAWHGKGSVVDEDLRRWDDVKAHLGIEWDIEPRAVFIGEDGAFLAQQQAADFTAAVRTDNGEVLAVNKSGYSLVGIDAFGRFVEAAMSDLAVSWDAFNVLDGGRAVCATIKLDEPISVPGDDSPVYPYVGFSNRVDAKGSLLASPTAVRQVCWNTNTLFLASAEDSGWTASFRHASGLDLDEAAGTVRAAIREAREAFSVFGDTAALLADRSLSPDVFVGRWLPVVQHMDERVIERVVRKRDAFWEALNGPRGMDRKDSAWAVLQAAIDAYQYSDAFPTRGDHGRTKRSIAMIEARHGRGRRNDDLRRAYSIVMEKVA